MATVNLLPDAEGSIQQWDTTSSVEPPTYYTEVDDPVGTPDDDSTYVYVASADRVVEFNHATSALLTGMNITKVSVYAGMRYQGFSFRPPPEVNIGLKVAGTRYPAATNETLGSGWSSFLKEWLNNPAGGSWKKSDIDNLQTSLESIIVAGFGLDVRCTQIYLTVTYFPAVTPVAGKGLVSWTP